MARGRLILRVIVSSLAVLAVIPGEVLGGEPTDRPLLRLETGMHTAVIWQVATDAAGRWAVTASNDKTARVWDLATGQQVATLRPPQDEGNEGMLNGVAMSPDGAVVAVGGWTGMDWDGETTIYLFDRSSGRLLRAIGKLPAVILHLTYSPDGRYLAATLGRGGVRVLDLRTGEETARDTRYRDRCMSANFSPDGRRLVVTAYDGQLRVYAVAEGKLTTLGRARPDGGVRPIAASFSPSGLLIAVAFEDNAVVQVLDAETLTEVARPDTSGLDLANAEVAWSADGRILAAGGRWRMGAMNPVRRWRVEDWSIAGDVRVGSDTVMDLAALPDAGFVFATSEPAWGVIDAEGRVRLRQGGNVANPRVGSEDLLVSIDGRRVRFGYEPMNFDVEARALGENVLALGLAAARTRAPGIDLQGWHESQVVTLNGERLDLLKYEFSRSLALAPDGRRFVLGTEWNIRLFDESGKLVWARLAPETAYAVNVTGDGRFVAAHYGDGTIRWHRLSDGEELLAFFLHADRRRWVAWTPEGFYAASGPDAEELVGYHLNRGKDHEGEFVSARQLREHFYQPSLVSRRLDPDGDQLVADAVARLGDVAHLLAGAEARPPALELLSPARVTTAGVVSLRVQIRDQGGGVGRGILRVDGVELEGRQIGTIAEGTQTLSITLSPGRHVVSFGVLNTRGLESRPVRVAVDVNAAQSGPVLHVLAVGVTNYREKGMETGVRFAAGDAKEIARVLGEQGKRLYQSVDVQELQDEKATGAGISKAVADIAARTSPQDVFVLYLAGHGMSIGGKYHFVPWDAVYTSAESLRRRSLDEERIRDLLAKVPVTKSLVLLDTCASGVFGGLEGRSSVQKDAIDRLSRLTGRALIAATADETMALEGEGGHGVFTFALLEGLAGKADRNGNGTVEVRELADYAEERLPEITKKWNYLQLPFSSTEGHSFPLVPGP